MAIQARTYQRLRGLWFLTWGALMASIATAQMGLTSPPRPSSYSTYFDSQVRQFHRPPASSAQYTIDKFFYHNPDVSPYLNLLRTGRTGASSAMNNYYAFVLPEIQRRDAAQQSFTPQYMPPAPRPSTLRSVPNKLYYNKFYNHP